MPTYTVSNVIANPGFEDGDTGWIKGTGWTIGANPQSHSGANAAGIDANSTGNVTSIIRNANCSPIAPGEVVTAGGAVLGGGASGNVAAIVLYWLDAGFNDISFNAGNFSTWGSPGTWELSTVTATAPSNAIYVQIAFTGNAVSHGGILVDDSAWSYVSDRTAVLQTPVDGSTVLEGEEVLLSCAFGGTTPNVTQVVYKEGSTILATTTSGDFSYNISTLAVGAHPITAYVTLANTQVITTNTNTVTISATPPVVITREYKASNAYTYLLAQNFIGLGSAIPSVAKITGVEILLNYKIKALIRSKDIGIDDPLGSNSSVAFDITDGAVIEATLLAPIGTGFELDGTPINKNITLDRVDFSLVETLTSENKKLTVMETADTAVTMGSSTNLFGLTPVAIADFIDRSLGIRFLPQILSKPAYADSGDCCFRFGINQLKLRVYFDAGSAAYYFTSPDKSMVIKGMLVSSNVNTGDFRTGDATGELQLEPTLTIMDGAQTWIGDDWTIHAAYPPTDANQIGTVFARTETDGIGLAYNGLPSAESVLANRSRFEMITSNFFAVDNLDSIYGVHGLPRAFAYNGTDFYNIHTQPTASKDQPRHVANHHGSLALGFSDGRVDVSVAGQPYNFDGVLGASEWSNGDPVVGLLSLPGTILGVFCKKSIWGLNGTTVDNYSVQDISPHIGAIEYTVTDMGAPVYANSFGIYTMSQTQQYGDYLGSPMSQNISPWVRPRMIRKLTSDKEVIVAWPVRTKNQYRLAFSDGYVLSMTMNVNATLNVAASPVGQDLVTFSFQKYFITPQDEDPDLEIPLLQYPSIVPIAISSQLDDTGEERIHMADKVRPNRTIPNGGESIVVPWLDYVYETEKGWSFDGNYIPHYLEINWFFGDDPTTYKGTQKVSIHGLTKGLVNLQMKHNGVQPDYDGIYSSAQEVNLIRKSKYVTSDYFPVTNYADAANRGIGMQFKFEGSNTDITAPEPGHALQVLVLQGSAQGTGFKSN